jgi:hypothetical protein
MNDDGIFIKNILLKSISFPQIFWFKEYLYSAEMTVIYSYMILIDSIKVHLKSIIEILLKCQLLIFSK